MADRASLPSHDPEALVRYIFDLLLLSNPNCREHLGQNAYEHAKAYAWLNIVSQMMQVYADLAFPVAA